MYIPNFRITPYLLSLIDSISSLRAWIENYPAGVARLSALSRDAMARSAHSSTSIEGNPLTLQQVEALERGESLKTGDVYIKEVKNCLKALRHIEKKAKKPIDEKAVLGLHRIIMKDILPEKKIGRYKTRQNHVVDSRGRRVYTPPSPGKTPEQLRQMLKWIN